MKRAFLFICYSFRLPLCDMCHISLLFYHCIINIITRIRHMSHNEGLHDKKCSQMKDQVFIILKELYDTFK